MEALNAVPQRHLDLGAQLLCDSTTMYNKKNTPCITVSQQLAMNAVENAEDNIYAEKLSTSLLRIRLLVLLPLVAHMTVYLR